MSKNTRDLRIIISPAKKMNIDTDSFPVNGLPPLIKDTNILCNTMQSLSYAKAKKMWACNDKIAELNYKRVSEMNLESNLTPAILAYEGIQYQYMAPRVFTNQELEYVNKHLRILSGFYGVLSPFDGVVPYRLEMQAKIKVSQKKNLYDFWGDKIYKEIVEPNHTIINLASKEYSRVIEEHLTPNDRLITCIFADLQDGKLKQKATLAKMARGEMVRFMATNNVKNVEELKTFSFMDFHYTEEYSSKDQMVFARNIP